MIECSNIFYISNFNVIGGVETYIYELARKYKNYDITVVYKTGDEKQLKRLKKYVRVIKYNNQKFQCKKAFFNYETDIIKNIEADEYIQLIHALFKTQGITPRLDDRITKYFSVSERASKEWHELTGIKPKVVRNPLTITDDEKKPVLYLISATRLTAEKGKERMKILGDLFENAGYKIIWLVFTNDTKEIDNPNIVYMKPTLDIRPYIASMKGKGYGVQLSDSEGDCFFTRECEAFGVPLLVTPIPSFKEQGLVDGKNCYYIPFDMKNINIDKIVNKIPEYDGYVREDKWDKELVKSKSTYQKELKTMVKVKCINDYFDMELGELKTKKSKPYKVNKIRADELLVYGDIEIVKEGDTNG